jgi:hypothetical protein
MIHEEVVHGHQPLLAGAGLQPCGCQSLLASACFQGESSRGSFFAFLCLCVAGTFSVVVGTGGSCGIRCASASSTTDCGVACCSSILRSGAALSLVSWSAFICTTPLSGSLDCSICMGCCLSGASIADGFDAHRASASDASTFIRSCRMISWCCSVTVGGSKRVCRSHCIHDAATYQSSADAEQGKYERDTLTSPKWVLLLYFAIRRVRSACS